MKAFLVSVSLALILTTSAVAAAMEYLDDVQAQFAPKPHRVLSVKGK